MNLAFRAMELDMKIAHGAGVEGMKIVIIAMLAVLLIVIIVMDMVR